ncbi:uncharacterized protein [Ptychodera flava]|uniref:uncharacterized protein n=1 Tax=Ptychodera flava TaxID=63121 RepID=UPI00396A563E
MDNDGHVQKVLQVAQQCLDEEFEDAAEEIRILKSEMEETNILSNDSESINIAVSADGSWSSRGYTTFVGDGDSSAYHAVKNIYEDVEIQKEECVGHIQKRMGTRLRRLVDQYKGQKLSDGKGLTGRGRLTRSLINSIQIFYGMALRNNKGNAKAMSESTKAIVAHYSSTYDNPKHDFCPKGGDSWCKYQSDLATGKCTYRPLKRPIPDAIVELLQPEIDALADEALLKNAEMCLTQNANESLHHVIWGLVPKEQNHGRLSLELRIAMGIAHFNSGLEKFNCRLYDGLRLPIPEISRKMWKELDGERIRDIEVKSSSPAKKRRKINKYRHLAKMDKFEYQEGPSYASGQFSTITERSSTRMPMCSVCMKPRKGHPRRKCTEA